MKFTVKKTVIVDALSSALGVVEKRQAIPVLSNHLLQQILSQKLRQPFKPMLTQGAKQQLQQTN